MNFSIWLGFAMASVVISVSPGSGAVLSMSHGLSYGLKKSSATILGLQAGGLVILTIAGAGVGSILLASNVLFTAVKTVGALYLIYLGITQWRAKVVSRDTLAKSDATVASDVIVGAVLPSWHKRFLTGFFTNTTNPKGIIFMVAVLPQFITQTASLLPQLAILALTMMTIDMLVMHSYAYAASRMQTYFCNPASMKKQNRFFGGLLVVMGTALFFVKRSVR